MDETQRRKLSAKEFLEKNKKVGYSLLAFFLSLFILYFAFIYFYAHTKPEVNSNKQKTTGETGSFLGSLLPIYEVTDPAEPETNNGLLGGFNSVGRGGEDSEDLSKLVKIEDRPILGFVVFDKPTSIKSYIKNKPKICSQKVEVVTKKEEKSTAVLTLQNTLKNTEGYEDTPNSGVLDEQTREKLYIFQKRYADILYKNKANKEPTRVIDKETAHFLNLLCGYESENKDDFVQVPTLRYVLKETREIFDYNTDSKEKKQVDAKVATGTEDVLLSKDGELAVYRKDVNGEVDSIFYSIKTKSITHLEKNITTLDFTDKNLLVYGVPGQDGITIKTYNFAGNNVRKVASLPLNEWNIKVLSESEIAINSKPSALAEGIYMIMDLQTKKLRQLAGPLYGLSLQKTNIPEFTILSTGGQGTTKTLLLNNKTRNIGDFGINTFAEKCSQNIFAEGIFCAVPRSLSSNFTYPDDWYKGKMFTSDVLIYKSLSGTSTKVVSYLENRNLSIINLVINKNGIFFIDENTLSLFSLEL